MTYTATYSPEDNNLRLYASSRLDADTYQRVKAAGFTWAPKQELFVAPMWTPDREDLLIDLAGEIGDEDTSLVDRAEMRAERFEDYSEKRAEDAQQAKAAVDRIADGIPLGQPILVGHHSEKRARKDAEKIENGMRRAVRMWETSEYWKARAAGAIGHAKYKELPAVRARRIKGLEADKRKHERSKEKAELCLKLWTKEGLTHEQAVVIATQTEAGYIRLKRKEGDRPDFDQRPSACDVLTNAYPSLYAPRTLDEMVTAAKTAYPRMIAYCDRWIAHLENRLVYERAMLEEQGATKLLDKKPRPKQLPLCNYRAPEGLDIGNIYHHGEKIHYPQVEMTQSEYTRIPNDWRGTRVVDHSHRVRTAMRNHSLVCVFLTDSKIHERPAPIEPEPPVLRERPVHTPRPAPEPTEFDAMRETLKSGVQVVSAPQLFPTPAELAARMVEEADIQRDMRVLEPSVGTGNIARAAFGVAPIQLVAVEVNARILELFKAQYISWNNSRIETRCADFLSCNGDLGTFDRIIMNPPFENAADIKHIQRAVHMLKPGGRLVAVCANGPRQQATLKPMAEQSGGYYEPLPPDTFKESGTGVNAALLVYEASE